MSAIGGQVTVNPSGGLLAKGHPLGATGVAQVFEIVTQLRGQAGERQVRDARIGLTHCQGFGGATGVHIFTR
jgi:acetyl-CoA acetyltransferase